jgi:hypothetical protein
VCHFFFKNNKPLVPSSGLEHQRVVQRWMVPETRKGEVKKVGGVGWGGVWWGVLGTTCPLANWDSQYLPMRTHLYLDLSI